MSPLLCSCWLVAFEQELACQLACQVTSRKEKWAFWLSAPMGAHCALALGAAGGMERAARRSRVRIAIGMGKEFSRAGRSSITDTHTARPIRGPGSNWMSRSHCHSIELIRLIVNQFFNIVEPAFSPTQPTRTCCPSRPSESKLQVARAR